MWNLTFAERSPGLGSMPPNVISIAMEAGLLNRWERRLDHRIRACDGIHVPATAPTLRGFNHRPVGSQPVPAETFSSTRATKKAGSKAGPDFSNFLNRFSR